MFDVITFGSATRDMFVRSKEFKVLDSSEFVTGKAIAVSAGSKIKVDELIFATGGGGTNTAATFALQELLTAYVGLVGDDPGGREIIRELEDLGVKTIFVKVTSRANTPYSIILSAPGEERSILVYEGASHLLEHNDIPWNKIEEVKWFYIAGLSGESAKLFKPIIVFAADHKIKLAVNPGRDQLSKDLDILKQLLDKIDILIVNQEEASIITGVDFKDETAVFKKFDKLVPGIAVMSKGAKGVAVSDGQKIYRAGIPKSGYIDRTGSGDAFGSGFVSSIIGGGSIESAIQLGTANATSTVQSIGAKTGLLRKGEWGSWEKVEVTQSVILRSETTKD